MTALAPVVSSTKQTYGSQRTVHQAISAGATSLPSELVDLVTQYLFNTKDWMVEWTGVHGYEVIQDAVVQATPLLCGPVSLVMQYLKKGDVFGLRDLETAAGEGDPEKGSLELTRLLKGYNPQKTLPCDIDEEMQTSLSKHFNAESLRVFPNINKVTELFSLYWRPARCSANIWEELAKKHGQKFHKYSHQPALQQHGDTPSSEDCWIQFPNDVVGRNKTIAEQEVLVPAGFEFPHFSDAVFCVFTKYVCTKTRILPDAPYTCTRCQEETQGYKLLVGGLGAGGLTVSVSSCDYVFHGVAPLRKFC